MIQLKEEHKNFTPIELSLLTWYKPDNVLYKDGEHPTIKLAGEIGELLDLYGKHKFKPNFDWMNCKHCKGSKEIHNSTLEIHTGYANCNYIPIVLDELGDIWYYLRILVWMSDSVLILPEMWHSFETISCIKEMYLWASHILYMGLDEMEMPLNQVYYYLNILLANLDYTLEDLTLINYQKLVLDSTNHGWKDAR